MHAELIAELLRLFKKKSSLLFNLRYVMLATSSPLSLTPLTYHAGLLCELLLILVLFSCLSSGVIV